MEGPLFAEGFDGAIVGIAMPSVVHESVIVYDYNKCIDILKIRDGMSEEEAMEYLEFNTLGAHMGDYTPIFIHTASRETVEQLVKVMFG